MAEDEDINLITKKNHIHKCSLPKPLEAIDEFSPGAHFLGREFRKFCLISSNVAHRNIYVKSTKVLDKERRIHLLNHYWLFHPFSDFSYYWGLFMLCINTLQLVVTPILILQRVKMQSFAILISITQLIGFLNIIIIFNTGYYRYDIKEVMLDRRQIASHYLKTLFIPDFLGNFPIRILLEFLNVDRSIVVVFKLVMACNAANFIKCLEDIREKRDLDLVIVRVLESFAITGIGLLWITALTSLAANIDQESKKCRAEIWWLIYLNFILLTGTSVNEFTYVGYEFICKALALSFGCVMRYIILVQLILLFKTYILNVRYKTTYLSLEINEFCHLKKLPVHLRIKIFKYYEYKFHNVYYNESDIWLLLSESMRQNILDYDSKAWFNGDIFKLCPLVLRQLISIHLDKHICLKDDVIYSHSDKLTKIYFIKTGTVVLYDEDGNLAHLISEGNFFSEKSLLLKEGMGHMYKAVAYENCQLFSLKKEMFQELIKSFPDEYAVILDILSRRHQYILKNKRISKHLKLADYYADLE